jgi:hypothetical protein
MTDTHFEYLQLQNDWHQQQDNETSGEDVSKVDKYKPHDYDCGSYTHRYSRQPSHLDPETHDESDY